MHIVGAETKHLNEQSLLDVKHCTRYVCSASGPCVISGHVSRWAGTDECVLLDLACGSGDSALAFKWDVGRKYTGKDPGWHPGGLSHLSSSSSGSTEFIQGFPPS